MTKATLVSEFQAEYRIFKKAKQCYMSTVAQQNGTKDTEKIHREKFDRPKLSKFIINKI